MKKIAGLIMLLSMGAMAQTFTPVPRLMFTMSGGVPTPASGSGAVLPFMPDPFLCYGLNTEGQAAPCNLSGNAGTVTSVTVTPANGVSATVANQGTTPALTVTLGAITPTSVAASSTISAGGILSASNYGAGEVSLTTCASPFSVAPQLVTVTLAANCTFTIANGSALQLGRNICFHFIQPATGTGPFTVTPPANVHGFFTVGTNASGHNLQCFIWSNASAIWLATSPGVINQ